MKEVDIKRRAKKGFALRKAELIKEISRLDFQIMLQFLLENKEEVGRIEREIKALQSELESILI